MDGCSTSEEHGRRLPRISGHLTHLHPIGVLLMRRGLAVCSLAAVTGCAGLWRGMSQVNWHLTPTETREPVFQESPQLVQFYLENGEIVLTQSTVTAQESQAASGGTVVTRSTSRRSVDIVRIKMLTPLAYVSATRAPSGLWREVTLDAGAGIHLSFVYTGKCPQRCWPDIYTRMQPGGDPEFTLSAVNGASIGGNIPLDGRMYTYSTPESRYPPSIAFWSKSQDDAKVKTTERAAPGRRVP